MPALKNRVVLAARGVKAFLGIEVGLTRGEAPILADEEIRTLHRQVEEKEQ